jgi:hypothetical protein
MGVSLKVIGEIIKLLGTGDLYIVMEMFMRVNGKMIKVEIRK